MLIDSREVCRRKRNQHSPILIIQPFPANATALLHEGQRRGHAVRSGNVSSITICMVRFVLYNTSQHFVSREGITFACCFVLKSDWLLLNL